VADVLVADAERRDDRGLGLDVEKEDARLGCVEHICFPHATF
jgi:hypothetical protein